MRSIQEKLKSNNKHLDRLVEVYFIPYARLDIPILGNYSFTDISVDFENALKEYSITHSRVIEPYNIPSLEELLKMNHISIKSYESLTIKVNEVLKSHTDEVLCVESRRQILEKQIKDFTDYEPDEDREKTKYKMFQSLSEDTRNDYLNSILTAMKKAEVNQMNDNKYMTISKWLKTYDESSQYLEDCNFREKRKYLQKLQKSKPDNAKSLLSKYTTKLLDENENDIKIVQWFFFYLIYGKNAFDIFMIHSLLGYKYKGATKLYQKLFCKGHTTGDNDNFLHHTDIFKLQKKHLDNEAYHLYEEILHYIK